MGIIEVRAPPPTPTPAPTPPPALAPSALTAPSLARSSSKRPRCGEVCTNSCLKIRYALQFVVLDVLLLHGPSTGHGKLASPSASGGSRLAGSTWRSILQPAMFGERKS